MNVELLKIFIGILEHEKLCLLKISLIKYDGILEELFLQKVLKLKDE
jgi:hypothetical protein